MQQTIFRISVLAFLLCLVLPFAAAEGNSSITFWQMYPENGSYYPSYTITVKINSTTGINAYETARMWVNNVEGVLEVNSLNGNKEFQAIYRTEEPNRLRDGLMMNITIFAKDLNNDTAEANWSYFYKDELRPSITSQTFSDGKVNSALFDLKATTDEPAHCTYLLFNISGHELDPDELILATMNQQGEAEHNATINLFDYPLQKYGALLGGAVDIRINCSDYRGNHAYRDGRINFSISASQLSWLEEPTNIHLQQGGNLTVQLSAESSTGNDIRYYMHDSPQRSFWLGDENYKNRAFEPGLSGKIFDVLRDGETKTYTLGGYDYEVTAVSISSNSSILSVNGVLSNLNEGEQKNLGSNILLKVVSILTNNREGLVEFSLSVLDDDYNIMILASELDEQILIQSIKYQTITTEPIYVSSGQGIREHLANPEYMLSPDWDITYAGLVQTPSETIVRLKPVSESQYNLEFTNILGQFYDIPFIVNKNGTLSYGDESHRFVLPGSEYYYTDYARDVSEGDYFFVRNETPKDSHTPSYEPKPESVVNIIQYLGINELDQTVSFEDLAGGTIVAQYNTSDELISGYVNVSNSEHYFFINQSDLERKINVKIYPLGDAYGFWGMFSWVLDEKQCYTNINGFDFTVNASTDHYDEIYEKWYGAEDMTLKFVPKENNRISAVLQTKKNYSIDPSNPNHVQFMNSFGMLFDSQGIPNNDSYGQDITIHCPSSQKYAQAFVTGGAVEVIEGDTGFTETIPSGDAAEFKAGSDVLSVGERLKDVKTTFTAVDLAALKNGVLSNQYGSTPVKQYLRFNNNTMFVDFGINKNTNQIGDFLFAPKDSNLFEYHMEFTEGVLSDVDDYGHLSDFEGEVVNLLGTRYIIDQAMVDDDDIWIKFSALEVQSDFVHLNENNGVFYVNPPSDYTGTFNITFIATDGVESIEKTITIEVTPTEEVAPPPVRRGGGGGGGGGAISNITWKCDEWSECKNGKQEQSCKSGISTKKNTQNCTVNLSPVISIVEEENEAIPESSTAGGQITTIESNASESVLSEPEEPKESALSLMTGNVIGGVGSLFTSVKETSNLGLKSLFGAVVLLIITLGYVYAKQRKNGL